MEHKNLEEEILSQLDEGFLTTGVDSKHTRYDEIPTLAYSKHHLGHGIAAFNANDSEAHGWHHGTDVPAGNHVVYHAHGADENDNDQKYHLMGDPIGKIRRTPEEAANDLKKAGLEPPNKLHLNKLKAKAKEENAKENRGTMAASLKGSSYESVEVTSNPIIEMVDSVIAGELTESTGIFEDLLAYKIAQKLEEKKLEVAQSIVEARYSSSKETFYRGFDDSHKLNKKKREEKSDEVEEKESVNHPLRQLENIKDQYESPISDEERKTGNEAATQNALAKRLAGENKGNSQTKAKVGGSSGIEHFKHTNGKSTHLSYDEIKLLHHHLGESGALKPTTKAAALSAIHSSPEGLAKVLGALRK